MGSQAFAHTDIELGSRKCLSYIADIRGPDSLSQIPRNVVFSDQVHIFLHCRHKFPVVAHILNEITVLFDLNLYTGANRRTLCTAVNDCNHFF